MFRLLVRVCTASVTLCAACSAATPVPATPAPAAAPATAPQAGGALRNFATVTESASTNTPGIVIIVRADGMAHWKTSTFPDGHGVRMCRSDEGEVPLGATGTALLQHIPSDVRLAALPVASCAKPASFRTTTTLDHFDDTSGDLSCPASDPRTAALARDVDAVKRAVLAACR